jgi:hypothetical protein
MIDYLSQKRALHSAKIQSHPSVCRCCKFYAFQGRGSGYCQKLGVSVEGYWHSCPFALSPFAPSQESLSV